MSAKHLLSLAHTLKVIIIIIASLIQFSGQRDRINERRVPGSGRRIFLPTSDDLLTDRVSRLAQLESLTWFCLACLFVALCTTLFRLGSREKKRKSLAKLRPSEREQREFIAVQLCLISQLVVVRAHTLYNTDAFLSNKQTGQCNKLYSSSGPLDNHFGCAPSFPCASGSFSTTFKLFSQ